VSPAVGRIGYHYYPDERHYTQKDLETWLPILASLGARWVTLRGSTLRAIPEAFLRALIDADISPIVHIPGPLTSARTEELIALFGAYAHWGVGHVVVSDQPNMRSSWPAADWGRAALVERYLDRLLPILQAERAAGLHPVFPPLEPGGDYWDTAFLGAALTSIARRGQHGLIDELVLALYAWTYDRALEWGKGGPRAWPQVRPYSLPEGSQDERGFRIFDWYAQVSEATAGKSLPMLAIAAGVRPDPTPKGDGHLAEANLGATRVLMSGDVPEQLMGLCFYLLTAEADDPNASSAWFVSSAEPRAFVDQVRSLIASVPTARNTQLEGTSSPAKPLRHYLLLPETSGAHDAFDWSSLGEYVNVFRPAVGFSVAEAKHAQEVTIIGNPDLIPPQVELELRQAGCKVHRVTKPVSAPTPQVPWSPTELVTRLETHYAGVRHGH
jgi:hypothetical protein